MWVATPKSHMTVSVYKNTQNFLKKSAGISPKLGYLHDFYRRFPKNVWLRDRSQSSQSLRLYIPAYHWHWVATSTPPSLGLEDDGALALSVNFWPWPEGFHRPRAVEGLMLLLILASLVFFKGNEISEKWVVVMKYQECHHQRLVLTIQNEGVWGCNLCRMTDWLWEGSFAGLLGLTTSHNWRETYHWSKFQRDKWGSFLIHSCWSFDLRKSLNFELQRDLKEKGRDRIMTFSQWCNIHFVSFIAIHSWQNTSDVQGVSVWRFDSMRWWPIHNDKAMERWSYQNECEHRTQLSACQVWSSFVKLECKDM